MKSALESVPIEISTIFDWLSCTNTVKLLWPKRATRVVIFCLSHLAFV